MTRIIQGVINFQNKVFDQKKELFEKLGSGQQPEALLITCSDSRIAPDLLMSTEPGQLFIIRNAGNIVQPHSAGPFAEAGTIEFAVKVLKVRDIIICGHARCGAIHGVLHPDGLKSLPTVAAWVKNAEGILDRLPPRDSLTPDELLVRGIQENVLLQLENLKTHPSVKEALDARKLRLNGWVYHFETGAVESYNPLVGGFEPIEKELRQKIVAKERGEAPREIGVWDNRI